MGQRVPLEDLPPPARAGIRPGTPAFAAYAADAEKSLGLLPGALTGAKFTWAPGTDPLEAFAAIGSELKANPGAPNRPPPAAAPAASPAPSLNPTDGVSDWENFAAGAGKAVVDTGRGLGQMVGLVSQEDIDEAKRLDAPLMDTKAGMGGNITGQVAQTVGPTALLAKGAAALRAAPAALKAAPALVPALTTPIAQGAATGAAFSAAQPVASGESRGVNAVEGGAGGALGTAIGRGIARAGTAAKEYAEPVVKRLAEVAENAGIPLRASQISDSTLGRWAAGLTDLLPFGGSDKLSEAQRKGLNRALARSIGADTEDALGALREARPRLNAGFNALNSKNSVQLEPWHVDALEDTIKGLRERGLDQANRTTWAGRLDAMKRNVVNSTDENGVIPGPRYQEMRTELGDIANGTEGTQAYRMAADNFKTVLDKAFDSGLSKADAAKKTLLRKQWANMKDLEKVAPEGTAAGADFDFAKLSRQLRSNAKSNGARKTSMIYGTGDQELPDLARVGLEFLVRGKPVSPAGKADSLVRLGKAAISPAATAGAGLGLYNLQKDTEHPFLATAAELGALGLLSKGAGAGMNSRWWAQGVPAVKRAGEVATTWGGQAPTAALNAWRSSLPAEPAE